MRITTNMTRLTVGAGGSVLFGPETAFGCRGRFRRATTRRRAAVERGLSALDGWLAHVHKIDAHPSGMVQRTEPVDRAIAGPGIEFDTRSMRVRSAGSGP